MTKSIQPSIYYCTSNSNSENRKVHILSFIILFFTIYHFVIIVGNHNQDGDAGNAYADACEEA